VAEKEYIIPYSEDARKRHDHKTIRGIDDNWETYKHKFLEGDLP
jgi:hypothetical protein